jgi:hypothetical protein
VHRARERSRREARREPDPEPLSAPRLPSRKVTRATSVAGALCATPGSLSFHVATPPWRSRRGALGSRAYQVRTPSSRTGFHPVASRASRRTIAAGFLDSGAPFSCATAPPALSSEARIV